MKKKLLILVIIAGCVYCYDAFASIDLRIVENVEALASSDGDALNGPQKSYSCPGWFTGRGYRCAAEIVTLCEQIPCS